MSNNFDDQIERGIKRYFDEKEIRESAAAAAKAKAEAKEKDAKSKQSIVIELVISGILLYTIWMCYLFVNKF